MGIFGRTKRHGADPAGNADATFPFLTIDEAIRIRVLAQQAFAEAGTEVVVWDDHLKASDGDEYGLANLAATCHDSPNREWPKLVREHVRRILAATQSSEGLSELEHLPRETVLPRVYLRVTGTSTVPPESLDWFKYAREVCGDILETLALDSPETVSMLRDQDVAAFGLAELKHAGLENLLREPIDAIEVLDAGDGAQLHVVLGDSVFTASKLLVLPELLARVFGDREFPNGVLVAVPFRHQIVLHPVDGAEAIAATNALAQFAARGFLESAGPVSPFVYWWLDGDLTQISKADADGALTIDGSGDFGDLMGQLAGEHR